MENNLLQNIKAYFTEDVLNKLASHLGEEKEQIRKGVDIAVPSLLLGLQSRNQEGLESILQSAKHLFSGFDLHDILGNYFKKDDRGERAHFESDNLTGAIFGDKFDGIVQSVSKYLGMSSESTLGLFGASIPAVISGITGKGGRWDVKDIAEQLKNSRTAVASAIPPGFGLGAFGSMFASADTAKELQSPDPNRPIPPAPKIEQKTEDKKKGAGILWVLFPIIIIALWFLYAKGCSANKDMKTNQVTDLTDSLDASDSSEVMITTMNVELPDGSKLIGYPSGIENQLVNFLQTDYTTLTEDELKDKWFVFDNLNFETGTANLIPSSQGQLDNLAKILKQFPGVRIKIGGYTDATGDEVRNKELSQQRANVVKVYLEGQGLADQVIGAEGYGSEFAQVAWDASDRERAKDRRVAISVRK